MGELAYEEALQAGRIGLWRAIPGYDPERGTAFSIYAWTAIMRSVWTAVKKAGKGKGETVVALPIALSDCKASGTSSKAANSVAICQAHWP